MNRLAVVMPTWLGDCVMATPLLRALRRGLPETTIIALCGGNVTDVLDGLPAVDELVSLSQPKKILAAAKALRATDADAVVLLPNAFRWAAVARLAGVRRRIGYARDGRGWLLTDRVPPPMQGRRHRVVPAIRYYLGLLPAMGLAEAGRQMELAVTSNDEAATEAVLQAAGLAEFRRLALLVPGGHYGSAKLWPAEHFADLADRLSRDGFAVAISTAPGEEAVADSIADQSDAIPLYRYGLSLQSLKGLCRRAELMVTNDTGARHIAVALGCPTVTLFGPTDPERTTLNAKREREVFIDVPCRPCQQKICPLPEPETKRCLTELSPELAYAAVVEVLSET